MKGLCKNSKASRKMMAGPKEERLKGRNIILYFLLTVLVVFSIHIVEGV